MVCSISVNKGLSATAVVGCWFVKQIQQLAFKGLFLLAQNRTPKNTSVSIKDDGSEPSDCCCTDKLYLTSK